MKMAFPAAAALVAAAVLVIGPMSGSAGAETVQSTTGVESNQEAAEAAAQSKWVVAAQDSPVRTGASVNSSIVNTIKAGQGTAVRCQLRNGHGNIWFRMDGLPNDVFTYSGNFPSYVNPPEWCPGHG